MGKHSKVSSATKWRLGENFVLRLMESLTPSAISHLFVCLPTLELTTFEQYACSTKIGYANALSLGTNSCKERNMVNLNSTYQAKKQFNFDSGWLEVRFK